MGDSVGGGAQESTVPRSPYSTFDFMLQQKDLHVRLLATGREALLLASFCCLSSFFSPKFACTASIISVVILEQVGRLLFTYSLSVTLTTAAYLQREWGGASCSSFKYCGLWHSWCSWYSYSKQRCWNSVQVTVGDLLLCFNGWVMEHFFFLVKKEISESWWNTNNRHCWATATCASLCWHCVDIQETCPHFFCPQGTIDKKRSKMYSWPTLLALCPHSRNEWGWSQCSLWGQNCPSNSASQTFLCRSVQGLRFCMSDRLPDAAVAARPAELSTEAQGAFWKSVL